MQSQLVAVSGFIVASRAALGADDMVAKAQADQLQHLIKVFGQIRPTTEDAQATLAMLGDPNGAPGFTTEQKRELARAHRATPAAPAILLPVLSPSSTCTCSTTWLVVTGTL